MVGFEPGVLVGYLRVDAEAAERAALEEAEPISVGQCVADGDGCTGFQTEAHPLRTSG